MQVLTEIQRNMLIASIMGDGEITKLYPGSRRKNNSYREHYGVEQKAYREWKVSYFDKFLYLTEKSNTVRSKSDPLFTEWFPQFYDKNGQKYIPLSMLTSCTLPHFLAVLYMDDGSLCITKRKNERNRRIYLSPSISLYLQCYSYEDLDALRKHCFHTFGIELSFSKRKDGLNYILKTTTVKATLAFLKVIQEVTLTCPSMYYKTNWSYRFKREKGVFAESEPSYTIISSDSERHRDYTTEEVKKLILLKQEGKTINEIAKILNRSYWSVVYKWKHINEINDNEKNNSNSTIQK
ncbi:DNA endonuclease [Salimicrobium flavidum]|uniref:LAGLIDADG DNA endonuclease family protein n=1 Tax=Salimicrobium flavidum TaxID=570947 RepID=A0A1N7J187_9BACI|nr:DNA endonuclease [Salimicrobium flavidum]SIS43016.1 LAGLIDADG DNA endonuclease family protein [Salimicrobium flavidum]